MMAQPRGIVESFSTNRVLKWEQNGNKMVTKESDPTEAGSRGGVNQKSSVK